MSLAPTHGQRNWWQRPKSRDRPLDNPHPTAYYDGQERDINRSDTFNMSKHPSNSRLRDLASALRLTKKPDRPVSSEPSPLTPRFRSNTVVGAKSKSTFSPVSTNSSYSTADRDSLDIPITPTSNSFWRSSGGGRDPFASQPMVITPTSTTSSQAREIPSLKPNRQSDIPISRIPGVTKQPRRPSEPPKPTVSYFAVDDIATPLHSSKSRNSNIPLSKTPAPPRPSRPSTSDGSVTLSGHAQTESNVSSSSVLPIRKRSGASNIMRTKVPLSRAPPPPTQKLPPPPESHVEDFTLRLNPAPPGESDVSSLSFASTISSTKHSPIDDTASEEQPLSPHRRSKPHRPWSSGKSSSKHGRSPVSEKEAIVDVNLKYELDAHQSKSPFMQISGAFSRRLKKVGSQSSLDKFTSPPRTRVESHASTASGSFKSDDSARTSMRHQRSFHNINGSVSSTQPPPLRHASSFHPTTPPKGLSIASRSQQPQERVVEDKRLKADTPGIRKRLFSGGSKDRGPKMMVSKGDRNEVLSMTSVQSDPISTNGDMSFVSSVFESETAYDEEDLKSVSEPKPRPTYNPRGNEIRPYEEIAAIFDRPPTPKPPPSPHPPETDSVSDSPASDFAPLPLSPPPRRRPAAALNSSQPISVPSRSPSINKTPQTPPPPPIRPSPSTETFISLRPAPRRLSAIPRKASITSTLSSQTVSSPPNAAAPSSSSTSASRKRAGSTSSRRSLRQQRGLSKKPSFLSLADDDDDDDLDQESSLSPSREEADEEDNTFSTSRNKRLLNEPLGPRDSVELVDDSFFDFGGRGHSFETIGGSQGSY